MLIDTHCHIHEEDYPIDISDAINRARQVGVMQMICVGTNEASSKRALDASICHDGLFASAGIHPHHATEGIDGLTELIDSTKSEKLVAIGEIGLDYYYNNSPRDIQIKTLEQQIDLALKKDLPIIFHVRDAYDDFWPILDNFKNIRGVLHCFTDNIKNANEGLKRGLFFGINGISTFTKDQYQKQMFEYIPIGKILLETDAPFLTPSPLRGKIKVNEPAFIKEIGEFNSSLHKVSFNDFAAITTTNARTLFKL